MEEASCPAIPSSTQPVIPDTMPPIGVNQNVVRPRTPPGRITNAEEATCPLIPANTQLSTTGTKPPSLIVTSPLGVPQQTLNMTINNPDENSSLLPPQSHTVVEDIQTDHCIQVPAAPEGTPVQGEPAQQAAETLSLEEERKALTQEKRRLSKWENELKKHTGNHSEAAQVLATARSTIKKLEYELKQERQARELHEQVTANRKQQQPLHAQPIQHQQHPLHTQPSPHQQHLLQAQPNLLQQHLLQAQPSQHQQQPIQTQPTQHQQHSPQAQPSLHQQQPLHTQSSPHQQQPPHTQTSLHQQQPLQTQHQQQPPQEQPSLLQQQSIHTQPSLHQQQPLQTQPTQHQQQSIHTQPSQHQQQPYHTQVSQQQQQPHQAQAKQHQQQPIQTPPIQHQYQPLHAQPSQLQHHPPHAQPNHQPPPYTQPTYRQQLPPYVHPSQHQQQQPLHAQPNLHQQQPLYTHHSQQQLPHIQPSLQQPLHAHPPSVTYGALPFSHANGMYPSRLPGYMPLHPTIIINQAPPQQQRQYPSLLEMLYWNQQQTIMGLQREMERMRWRLQPPAPYRKERPHYRQHERHVPRSQKTRPEMSDTLNSATESQPGIVTETENSSHSSSPVSNIPASDTDALETPSQSNASPETIEAAASKENPPLDLSEEKLIMEEDILHGDAKDGYLPEQDRDVEEITALQIQSNSFLEKGQKKLPER